MNVAEQSINLKLNYKLNGFRRKCVFLINNFLDRETWLQFIHSCITMPYLAVTCGNPSHGIACGQQSNALDCFVYFTFVTCLYGVTQQLKCPRGISSSSLRVDWTWCWGMRNTTMISYVKSSLRPFVYSLHVLYRINIQLGDRTPYLSFTSKYLFWHGAGTLKVTEYRFNPDQSLPFLFYIKGKSKFSNFLGRAVYWK